MERSGLVGTMYVAVTKASVRHASALGENASSGKEMVRLDDDRIMCALVADKQSSVAAMSNPKKEQY